jgi:general secretion pathway protein A
LYLQFFGLTEAPFSITPDPAFVYLSDEHRDALAHLLYGVGQGGAGGFVQLTGEVGTGKTTLCRCLLEQLPENTHVALVLNPLMTPRELLATICEELGIDIEGKADSSKAMVDSLNAYLLEQHASGHRVVVVIDEAQNLSPEALEQVRLLTNLETAKEKLLQMVLLGQPELRQLLQRQDLRQLSQRITARYHLAPLNKDETAAYVHHRMMVAGARTNPFRRSALNALYQRSGGVPRLINIIADRALAGAYARESVRVNAGLVNAAAREVQPSEERVRSNPWPGFVAAAASVLLVVVSVLMWNAGWFGPAGSQPVSVNSAADTAPQPAATESVPPEPRAAPGSETTPSLAATPGGLPQETGVPGTDAESVTLASEAIEPPEPVLASIDAGWLELQSSLAWQRMAELWGDAQSAEAIRSACDGLSGTGYSCVRDFGSWSRIRSLGLPVLIVLPGEEQGLLLLHGIKEETLLLGGPRQEVAADRNAVEEIWLGEYLVVWPQAPDWPVEIRRGSSGPAVEIVTKMAALAEPAWQGGATFDGGFESWLMAFQRRHGLKADGIIGPNTLIHLMAPTIEQPRLEIVAQEDS